MFPFRYEAGKWRYIQKDPELGPILKNRSNVDLKDKWRNLNMDSGGSRRESRASADKVATERFYCFVTEPVLFVKTFVLSIGASSQALSLLACIGQSAHVINSNISCQRHSPESGDMAGWHCKSQMTCVPQTVLIIAYHTPNPHWEARHI